MSLQASSYSTTYVSKVPKNNTGYFFGGLPSSSENCSTCNRI